MAALEHRRTESEFVSEPAPGRSATLCRADDLKLFMQQLSDQIADADRRHSGVLRDMLERLSRLGGQTETLKASLPKEFSADLERLEDGMASLAQRIAESDQARRPETIAPAAEATHLETPVVQPSALHALPSSEAEPEPAPALNWSDPSRAAFLTSPPALRSAVNAQSPTAWSRPESVMQNNGQNIAQSVVPSVGQSPVRPAELPHAADAAPAAAFTVENSDDPWDSQSAEALTKLYDSGEPGLPPKQHAHDVPTVHAPVLHASVAAAVPAPAPVAAAGSVQMPALGLIQAYAPVTAAPPLAPAEPAREQIEREWLDARLNDIAARVEQSLADLKPENSLADIGRRFDQLEERWTSALGDVATRSDVEGLRLVEAHIAELTTRLEETQTQLARLDAIEAQIAELGHQLTDEQVVRLFGNLIPTEADLTHFAEQASEKVAARLLADMPAPQAAAVIAAPADTAGLAAEALDLVQAAHADSTEQIGALQKMLAGFIDERRRGEAETAEALETMQHAMQHVLDRVDALDMARPVQSEARADEVAAHSFGHKMPGMPQGLPAHGGLQAGYVPGFAPGSASGSAPGHDAGGGLDDARMSAKAAAAAAANRFKAGLTAGADSGARQHTGDEPSRRIEPVLDPVPQHAEMPAVSADARGAAARAATDGPADRKSVVENARRAAAKTSAASVAAEAAPQPKAPSVRERLLGGGAGGEKAGIRPALLLVPSLAALLLVGVWFIASPKKNKPMPATAAIEEIVPATPGKPVEKPEMAPALAPANGLEPVPAPPAPPALKKDERSELPAMRGRSGQDPTREVATETGSISRTEASAGGARVVAGPLPGMAIQQSARGLTVEETMQAREKMHLASLSQRTAQNAAATSAVPPSAIPASLLESDPVAAPAAAGGGKAVVEMPPALIGPQSLRLAAAKGDPSAQFEVAARFAEGKGVKQDFVQAAVWYQRAASQGEATAQYRLAALYERGLGVKADTARARLWYKRAAEQGSVKAMHNLAVLSASRDQGTADYPTAVQWFGEAAERGLSDSQYNLGVLYESGLGVPKDMVAAYKWYAIAARSGDGEAIRRQQLLRGKLDAVALQRAEEGIEGWRPRPAEGLVNDALAAGTAWKARAGN